MIIVWKLINGASERGNFDASKLVKFNGKAIYSDPKFVWSVPVGVTSLVFLNSDKFGMKYQNDIFVGSVNPNGDLYHFDLKADRNSLVLKT